MLQISSITKLIAFLFTIGVLMGCSEDVSDEFAEDQIAAEEVSTQKGQELYTYHYKGETFSVKSEPDQQQQQILDNTHWVVTETSDIHLFDTEAEADLFYANARCIGEGKITFYTERYSGGQSISYGCNSTENIPGYLSNRLKSFKVGGNTNFKQNVKFYDYYYQKKLLQSNVVPIDNKRRGIHTSTSCFRMRTVGS